MKNLLLIALAFFLTACGGGDGGTNAVDADAVSIVKKSGFNGSIIFKKNDQTILQHSFGLADRDKNIANDIATRYRIGSLTKAFTALAIVHLKNTHLINDYDDPLSLYLPDYPNGNQITIRHLLNHLSGITEYTRFISPDRSYTPLEIIDLFKDRDLEFVPGSAFSYSNSNYILLGYLIEVLSKRSYIDYIQTHILSPLGMVNTEYANSTIQGADYAKGYVSSNDEAEFIDMSIPYAAGALSSNIIDMDIWASAFIKNDFISDVDKNIIFGDLNYSFGWGITTINQKYAYLHAGGISGFSSVIAILPDDNSVLIALSNVEGQSDILNNVVTQLINRY
ncbi:MAG: serine hydrolase domain-containing protein [Cellvibrionaceae bacterium]